MAKRMIAMMLVIVIAVSGVLSVSASAAAVKLTAPAFYGEVLVANSSTHPYGNQTNRLNVRWTKVAGATGYWLYIKGGQYSSWKLIKVLSSNYNWYTVTGLRRDTSYIFTVRAVRGSVTGPLATCQLLRTSRIDFSYADWQAMCRIVYHEVGRINDSMWNEPIVHVSDCIVNQYEAAKYLNDSTWAPYYRRYNDVQSIIYTSGGFMSSYGLSRDGADYENTTGLVRKAVYGALYNKITVDNIRHDRNVYFWSNTYYKPNTSRVSYSYRIPWGYFNVWNTYWG